VSNVNHVNAPYFGFLREMMRRAEDHAFNMNGSISGLDEDAEYRTTNHLYEIEALTNVVGELECARGECERRIRYLEALVAEDV
jgi:hypothetical protein